MLIFGAASASAQNMDDMNIQFHGYVTQGFIYSNQNSWNTTDSEDSSASWSDVVVNLSAQPESKLRIGVQARYFLLGDYGNAITLDWAQADYKVNEHLGFRVGKVKSPTGLLNETQDIDPAYLWILLPQSIYPLASRNAILSHYGGVVYGTASLGESLGKIQYRAFGGDRILASDDGYLQSFRDAGMTLPNGLKSSAVGGTLHWETPLRGLMAGATETYQNASGEISAGPMQGTMAAPRFCLPYFFGKYEHNKLMVAGEYSRLAVTSILQFTGAPPIYSGTDQRTFYAMTSYKLTEKFSSGIYYSYSLDHKAAFTSARYQKDWAISARYDFNPFLYAKLEQHFIDGTEIGFSAGDNPSLQPTTRMTLLKFGVSF